MASLPEFGPALGTNVGTSVPSPNTGMAWVQPPPALTSPRSQVRVHFSRVQTRSLSLAYGDFFALRRVEFHANEGEVVGVRGDNGAGKTSLFSVLCTQSAPTRGELLFDGIAAHLIRPQAGLRANIGLLGHASFLYGDLSGAENLQYYGRLYGLPEHSLQEACDWALESVGMTERRHRLVRACSRGMVQRLSLARLLLQNAQLWLLDEPMTGLDSHSQGRIEALIRWRSQSGGLVVVIAHDSELLGRVANRLVHLEHGSIRAATHSEAPC